MDVEFRILGPLDVLVQGRSLALGGRRERAVLTLLLLSLNRVVSSERLVDELWPDRPPKEALHSLRVAVSRLRKVLHEAAGDEVLCTVSPGYVIRTDPDRLDLARFESLVAQARQAMGRNQPQAAGERLREALSLWRGTPLADLAEAPFAQAESARLEEARLAALEARVEADLASGRHAELPAELDSLTRAHPLRETLWEQRMLALYRSGRQADALRAFQELRRILGEELGIEPSARLAGLESAMLRQSPDLEWKPVEAAPDQTGSAALFSDRTPFVGREAELAELRRLVGRVRAGAGALVMVGGEPGVGKTRLAQEISSACAREGFQTFTGHCYEMAGAEPYVPVVEAYEQALAQAASPEAFRRFLGDEAPEIARLVPKLRRLCPDIPPPLDLPAEQERRFLFNSVWEVLARTARARPTLLVLDDIHWADEPTMLLIQHLAERIAEAPVLIVGLYRDSEVDVGRPLSRTFEELTRRRLARRLPLGRLPQENVAEMLRALAGQEPPSGLVEVIYGEAEGNPFFTEEVFKHLAEEGRLFDADGRFHTDLAVDELDVPEGVRLVVGARLRRLGDDGRMALGSAAVLGRVFSFELLRHLAGLPEDRLLGLVEEAERARLVATVKGSGAPDRFIFAHELIRQTVLAELSAPRRQRLHARAADVLERVYASTLEQQAAALAHH
ncbi:MAG: AAA family ATPase, partial [Actinobacteria bacterium]|nr:AAA family ATPase [Actinomycetota bacterium]